MIMTGLVSITHLLSSSIPNLTGASHNAGESKAGLGMDASGMSASLPPCTPPEEERPGSSLSTASRTSRIPVLTRSASLRIKGTSSSATSSSCSSRSDPRAATGTAGGRGIVRSASFVSSRGMGSVTTPPSSSSASTPRSYPHPLSAASHAPLSSSSTPTGAPRIYGNSLTPEAPRRRYSHTSGSSPHSPSSYSSSYSSYTSSLYARRSAPAERKTHSFAGVGSSAWYPSLGYHHNHHLANHHNHHHTNTHRRPNFLPVSAAATAAGPPALRATASQPDTPSRSPDLEADDMDSVKSFGSVSSALSCDAAFAFGRGSSSSAASSSQAHLGHYQSPYAYRHTAAHAHAHHSGSSGSSSSTCAGGGGGGGGGKGGGGCGGGGGGGRNVKYALHCPHNHDNDPENYLTPTQRAARRIRELKSQLAEARREVHVRDAEISRLTRELVELRLLKARAPQREEDEPQGHASTSAGQTAPASQANHAPGSHAHKRLSVEGDAASSPSSALTPKTSATPSEGSEPELSRLMDTLTIGGPADSGSAHAAAESPAAGSVAETTADSVDLTRSLADSGHYDDLTSPCLSSKDPFEQPRQRSLRGRRLGGHHDDGDDDDVDEDVDDNDVEEVAVEVDPWTALEEAEARLRDYERREDQLKRNHMDEYHELKEKHNDRVESLLSKLSDANLKYFELRPMYDRSQEKIRELEREVTKLKDELTEAELRHQKMYLQMFLKGQQAAKLQADDDQDEEDGSQSSLSSGGPMVDLMKQLARTEEELEKMKGVSFLPPSLSSPGLRGLPLASLGAPKAALLDGKQAVSLYFQGRRQVRTLPV
ncbi:serine-rich adhesin for platelets-like isoform X2 [Penaeus japonicus]|uniref:serine-rich adhesin for platelets-like isoform X2 n=1 Tax=Penaeus japonicus TaxID=27405 RepID=UPI001C710F72|nr:serine-rich adhesin for platelets-like isoform X2 [Penaeus japonicus]